MHPQECEEMVKAWERKSKRERLRDASLQHIVALAGGMKKQNGGKLSLYDFAPDLKEPETQEQKEEMFKAFLKGMAAKAKAKKKESANGKA